MCIFMHLHIFLFVSIIHLTAHCVIMDLLKNFSDSIQRWFRWEEKLSNYVLINIWLAAHVTASLHKAWHRLQLPLRDTAHVCSSWSECRAEERRWSIATEKATPSTAETSSQKHGYKNKIWRDRMFPPTFPPRNRPSLYGILLCSSSFRVLGDLQG